MYKAARVALLMVALLLLGFTLIHGSARAGASGTSQGVTLIQFTCGEDPNNGAVYGPNGVGVSTGFCDGIGDTNAPLLPGGTLYNLRASVGAGTTDPTPATLKVTIYTTNYKIPVLECEATTQTHSCQDLTHSVSVNAGDTVSATVSIPDCNTYVQGVTLTIEENIIE